LGIGVPLLCCEAVPPLGLLVVLGDALASDVHDPKAVLGMGVPLLRIQTQLYDLC
jgi:hypothetical protein